MLPSLSYLKKLIAAFELGKGELLSG